MIILAASIMPTSAYIGIAELFRNINLKEKIFNIFKIVITSVLIFTCLGRAHTLRYGLDELSSTKNQFGSRKLTIEEKVNSSSKVIETSFISLPSSDINNKYLWNDVTENISILSLLILGVILIGMIHYIRKKHLIYITFLSWLPFLFILFIGLNWAPYESPLFNIYFSWAIIPLFVYGFDYVLDKLKINTKYNKYIYSVLLIFMISINFYRIYDIFNFVFNKFI